MERKIAISSVYASSEADFVAESNHRIANNIMMLAGMLRMRGREAAKNPEKVAGQDIRQMFEEMGTRLDAVAALHRFLAEARSTGTVELANYIRTIAAGVVSSLASGREVSLQVRSDGAWNAPPEKALPLGLMVAELVTNSVKYAHPANAPGKIEVECRGDSSGGLLVEVTDDGVGLPEGLDPYLCGNMGYRLLRALAERAGASIDFHSGELGFRVELRVCSARRAHSPVGCSASHVPN